MLNFGEKGDDEEYENSKVPNNNSGNSTPHGQNLIGKDINFNNATNTYNM